MLERLLFVAALVSPSIPALAIGQSAPPPAPAPRHASAVCDGSEIRRIELQRKTGGALVVGTALADLVAAFTVPNDPSGAEVAPSRFRFILATAPIALGGYLIASTAYPREGFWRRATSRMKVGETTSADVRTCLHRPAVTTTSGTEQRWTYVSAHPVALGRGSVIRTLDLTFRNDVLAQVSRTEVRGDAVASARHGSGDTQPYHHRGICIPAPTVFADPFPTPMDTTAASAALARAQADADAAAKNSANAATYAMCLASDTAQ